MKFGNTLAETLVPEWRQYYINYEGLKQRLKQVRLSAEGGGNQVVMDPKLLEEHREWARDTCDDFLESAQRPSTSLSIPRSLSQPKTALLQHALQAQRSLQQEQQQLQEQGSPSQSSSSWQQHGGSGPELCQGPQGNNPELQLKHSGSQPSLCVPAALQLDGGPTEQFLQLLQQELNKVREFIVSHGAALQAELTALAAAAPQLSQQDCQQLEQQANELGRQLLALEAYVQLNQAGFVKIVKKHDKWLPTAPIWHLYLHHLQRSPWLDDSSRQVMWAALSSCYYHLHAGSLNSSRANSRPQQQHRQQQQQQPSPRCLSSTASSSSSSSNRPGTGQQSSSTPAASAVGASVTPRPAKTQAAAASSSSKRVVGGLTSALGSAVAGAASVVAGAATAVAGASAAALAAAGGAAPSSSQAPPRTPEAEEVSTVKLTRKFWVAESDVPAVMYYILQHLPLLPSTANPAAAVNNNNTQGGDGLTPRLSGSQQLLRRQHQQQHASTSGNQQSHPQHQSQQQQGQQQGLQQQQQPRLLLQPALQGFATALHTVYFDNSALQLYHGRLYLRPQTQTLKARWIGHSHDSTSSNNPFLADCSTPDKVVLERKVYMEGWKGEPNTKDSLLIAGDKLPQYLAGAYTLGDALADLCEVPACKAQLIRASSTVKEQQQLWQSPFAQASGAAAGVEAVSAGGIDYEAAATAAAAAADGEEEEEAAMLAASVKVPKGFAIGSISSRSLGHGSTNGSHPSLLQLLERDRQWQQEEEVPQQGRGQTSECSAGTSDTGSDNQEGFADAYLDPPVPSADQLSLFMEVQRFVGRRRLRPVLHCVLQRMVFAMPFDNRIRITLDTDVRTKALRQDLPLSAADWQQQRQLLSSSRGGSGVLSPELSSDPPAATAAAAAAGLSSSRMDARQQHPLPPRPSSGGGSSNPVASDLQRSLAAWGAIFNSRGPQVPFLSGQYSGREPGSPVHWHSSSGDADAVVHTLPYALLKVTVQLPANQSAPDWLLQLMDSEAVTPVEDWSKFIHGCAVLLPETVRAVPYWMDDRLIELSVAALQAQLDAEEARRDQIRLQSLRSHSRRSSAGGLSAADNSSGGGAAGPAAALAGPEAGTSSAGHYHQQQQQQPLLQRLSGSFRSALARTSSSGMGAKHLSHSSSFNGLQQQEHQQLIQQAPSHVSAAAASARAGISSSGGSSLGHSRLRVTTAGSVPRVSWADGGGGISSSPAGGTPSHTDSATALAAAAGSGAGLLLRMWRLVRKQKPPPLFRPERFSGLRRPRRGNPVQLLESREFFYSEAVFLQWLHLAITIASVAILLMGYSSMAYVNPLKRPTLHTAEIICLLMLPCSCIIVGYAIRTYLWRRRRLHSMRYSRVDDPVGPLLMALVFVTSMSAIMMVNIADLVLLLKARDDSGGDDAGGGDEGGGDYQLWAASSMPGSAVAFLRARFLR